MIPVIQISTLVLFIVALIYYILIAVLTYGWYMLDTGFESDKLPKTKVSVVVAVRNEENGIIKLLNSLKNQYYKPELVEIIIVDDSSTDKTVKLVEEFIGTYPEINLKIVSSKAEGKKEAVKTGVERAKHEFILVTDGDSEPDIMWIRKMTGYYEKFRPKMILAPVVYKNEKSFFQKLFSLEFISLVASGAGAVAIGLPFMGNAANMGFEKGVYSENLNSNYASGDDVFFIHQIKKRFGNKAIHFLKDPKAVVKTNAPLSINAFFKQRLRWGSKAKGYKDFFSVLTASIVFIFNLGLFLMFIAALYYNWLFAVWFLFVLLKLLVDLPLLQGFARFAGKVKLLVYVLPLELIYPFYITIAGVASILLKYEWKGRRNLK